MDWDRDLLFTYLFQSMMEQMTKCKTNQRTQKLLKNRTLLQILVSSNRLMFIIVHKLCIINIHNSSLVHSSVHILEHTVLSGTYSLIHTLVHILAHILVHILVQILVHSLLHIHWYTHQYTYFGTCTPVHMVIVFFFNFSGERKKSRFYVYCKSTCKKAQPGKLRVRCNGCKDEAFTLSRVIS